MDIQHALDASGAMKGPVRVSTISSAGHQIFMDNPEGFTQAVINELSHDPTEKLEDSIHVQYVL